MTGTDAGLRIVLEVGRQKVFASAIDWPGWSRAGKKSPEAAIATLLAYADRYHPVVRLAGLATALPVEVKVIDRQPGNTTTEFGAPDVVYAVELEPMGIEECERQLSLLRASWRFLDKVASEVSPEM